MIRFLYDHRLAVIVLAGVVFIVIDMIVKKYSK